MDKVRPQPRSSFAKRVRDLKEMELDRIEMAGTPRPEEAVGSRVVEGDIRQAIPFRNVFANHFNNVIRPR
jgi:hypothetical protein